MATHEQIVSAYENYLAENESFETKKSGKIHFLIQT